jgi:serine/threonine-protein kinase
MKIDCLDDLIGALRDSGLLDEEQRQQLPGLAAPFADPAALARELGRRGWLTAYQAEELLAGRGGELVLGQYVVLALLGEGGMGKVLKARHRLMKRVVALKVIRPALLADPRAVQRFRREIEAVSRLSHPNIVAAYDANQVGDTHFLVMEYVEGTDLARVVKERGPLPAGVACEYVRQAAVGLQHAHEQGLVHRDIKPHNLLLAKAPGSPPAGWGVVKLLDMGLARLHSADGDGLTNTGAVMGTPDFIAPEQAADSHRVDIRADLYSLGCTLYFLLTGEPPFPGGTLLEKLFKHQYVAPRPVELRRPDLPPGVAAAVGKLLAKRPEERYQTPAELAEALAPLSVAGPEALPSTISFPDPSPDTARPVRPASDTMRPDAAPTRTDEASAAPPAGSDWSAAPVPFVAAGAPAPPESGVLVPTKPPAKVPPRRRGPLLLASAVVAAGALVAVALPSLLRGPWTATERDGGTFAAMQLDDTGKDDGKAKATARQPPDTGKTEWPKDTGNKKPPKETGKPLAKPPDPLPEGVICLVPEDQRIHQVAFAANGTRAVGSTRQDGLFVCSLVSTRLNRGPDTFRSLPWYGEHLKPPVPAASGLAISADGKWVYFGTRDQVPPDILPKSVFKLWDVESQLPDSSFSAPKLFPDITCAALSEKGTLAATGAVNRAGDSRVDNPSAVLVWTLEGRKATLTYTFRGHKGAKVRAVAVSPDGKQVASSADDDALVLWDPGTGDEKRRITKNAKYVDCIAFSPKGDRVVYGGDDRALHLIEVDSGNEVCTFRTDDEESKEAVIKSLAFSADGKRLISGNNRGAVCLWDVASGKESTAWRKHHPAGQVIAVGLSPDDKYAYSAASADRADSTICRWHLPQAAPK